MITYCHFSRLEEQERAQRVNVVCDDSEARSTNQSIYQLCEVEILTE